MLNIRPPYDTVASPIVGAHLIIENPLEWRWRIILAPCKKHGNYDEDRTKRYQSFRMETFQKQ